MTVRRGNSATRATGRRSENKAERAARVRADRVAGQVERVRGNTSQRSIQRAVNRRASFRDGQYSADMVSEVPAGWVLFEGARVELDTAIRVHGSVFVIMWGAGSVPLAWWSPASGWVFPESLVDAVRDEQLTVRMATAHERFYA
jgi:hypothetical protein